MSERGPVDRRIDPSASPPASHKPQKRRYQPKAKPGPESSTIDIDHIVPPVPVPDAPEAEGPSVPNDLKLSPIDLINKRLKGTSKKIARITSYASTNPQFLNADQKRFLKTLPTLEAIQKELNEVKNAIEMQETDTVNELIAENREAEKAESARIADTIASVQVDGASQHLDSQLQKRFVTRTIDLINVLRYSLLASGKSDALSTDKTEESIVQDVADALLGTDDDKRRATVEGFLQESGDFNGISYALFVDIAKAGLALPRTAAPPLAEENQEGTVIATEVAAGVIMPGKHRGLPKMKGINFVQESEVESFVGERPSHVWTEFAEESRRKPEEDEAATAEQKKQKEQRKREEEQRQPEEWRLVDQLRRDKAEAIRKRRKERGEEQKRSEELQLNQLKRDKAKIAAWRSRGAMDWGSSSSDVASWTRLEMPTWEVDESMGANEWSKDVWPSLTHPANQGSKATWGVEPTGWGELEASSSVREVKASEWGSLAQVAGWD
ncbi:hypothetical protein APHAL10511_002528 [Amanita phalloides]|nr:hypothetical protein APHAL10511_002528 [Amanita phalloides]